MPRYFTREEAEIALEMIRPLVAQILEIRQDIIRRQPEVWPVIERAAGNGGSRTASQLEREFERLDALVHAIQATGAVLKDIDVGLVDFLALRDGREVYLCWKYGEERLAYWHDINTGFSGRQII